MPFQPALKVIKCKQIWFIYPYISLHLYISANGSTCHSISSDHFVALATRLWFHWFFKLFWCFFWRLRNTKLSISWLLASFQQSSETEWYIWQCIQKEYNTPADVNIIPELQSHIHVCSLCLFALHATPVSSSQRRSHELVVTGKEQRHIEVRYTYRYNIKKINLPKCDYWEWIGSCPGVGVLLFPVVSIHSYSLQLVMSPQRLQLAWTDPLIKHSLLLRKNMTVNT